MPFVIHHGAKLHWDAQGEGPAAPLIMGLLYSAAVEAAPRVLSDCIDTVDAWRDA